MTHRGRALKVRSTLSDTGSDVLSQTCISPSSVRAGGTAKKSSNRMKCGLLLCSMVSGTVRTQVGVVFGRIIIFTKQ